MSDDAGVGVVPLEHQYSEVAIVGDQDALLTKGDRQHRRVELPRW